MAALSEDFQITENPIDLVEEFVAANSWQFNRFDPDEMMADVKGKWCQYKLHFLWREDLNALYFSAALDDAIPENRRAAVYELLAHMNEKMWMGHFEICHEEMAIAFRQTCLMRGQFAASFEQIEDLVDIALAECDRFFPAIQHVIQGGKHAEEALLMSLVDVAGMA